jgi:hypothetical protein
MIAQKVQIIRDEQNIAQVKVWRESGQDKNMYLLSPGDTCIVAPYDPLRKQHHGRHCRITELLSDDAAEHGVIALVEFLDNGKQAEVAPIDLIPVSVE